MNILILNYEYPPIGGGASNATYNLLRKLKGIENLNIDLVTSSTDRFLIDRFSKNINIHRLDIGKNGNLHYQSNKELLIYSFKAYQYINKKLNKKKYDLVHAFFGIPCGYLAMKLKIPYIVSLRGSDVPFYNERFKLLDIFVFKRLSKKIWKRSKKVIANSKGLRELALTSNQKQEISVIYNGVDTELFKPVINKKRNKKITLISTGRLIPRKGYRFLLEAIVGLDDIRLVLLGGGILKNELQNFAEQNSIDLKCMGKVDHTTLIDELNKSDIFILPSLNEGMSNSVLEAMACGLPVIVTDVGGSEELVMDNGFIVKKESSEELRNAVLKYKNNSDLLISHGKQSRSLAEKKNWSSMANSYLNIYKEIIQ